VNESRDITVRHVAQRRWLKQCITCVALVGYEELHDIRLAAQEGRIDIRVVREVVRCGTIAFDALLGGFFIARAQGRKKFFLWAESEVIRRTEDAWGRIGKW
jgi:hypothetical protein